MIRGIAAFEFRYQIRQPVFWIATILFFLLTFAATTLDEVQIGAAGNVHKNSPYALAQITLILSLFYTIVLTAFVANAVVRDDETGFGPIIRVTRISTFAYLNGRFAGAFLAAFLGFAAVSAGVFAGSFMPWVDPETLGPNRLTDYLYVYVLLALPTLLFVGAVLFAVATVTRSMIWSYVGVLAIVVVYTIVSFSLGRKPELETSLAYLDPLGFAAFGHATKYLTAAERNTALPALAGALLWNRAIWTLAAFGALAAANGLFRFAARGAAEPAKASASDIDAPPPLAPVLPAPRFDAAAARRQFVARTRFEAGAVLRSPAFFVLLALGTFNALAALLFPGELYGTEVFPVTRLTIQTLQGTFTIVLIIIAGYYAGEVVWRDRDRKIHEIIDASAAPDWAFAFPKVLAIAIVLAATLIVSVVTGIAVQAFKGYDTFALGEYLLWYLVPQTIDWTLIAILAVFLQTLAPNKFVGWGLLLVYFISQLTLSNLGWQNDLYQFGSTPSVPLSDMNGMGQFWKGAYWLRAYWGAFSALLLILSYALWRRGTETRLLPRLRRLPRRLRGTAGIAASAAVLACVAIGAFVYVNTHVWNAYRTTLTDEARLAGAEKALLPYERLPEPTITAVALQLDLAPHALRLRTSGRYLLQNRAGVPIRDFLVSADQDLRIVELDIPGAQIAHDYPAYNARLYRFTRPLAPGARLPMRFATVREQRGFRNDNPQTRIVDNGTFANNFEFAPQLGVDRSVFLKDRAKRRKYGLPPELRIPKLEDDSARAKNYVEDAPWVHADITLTTDADQTPIAPGYSVRDVTAQGRRTAEFRTEAPILDFFSAQSAHYRERHERHHGIDVAVYYDAQHPMNVDRMIRAADAGLDYYQANFSPYQFRQIRFIEFPDYQQFAQSFANTVPWSEALGFIADVRDPDKIDYVTYVAAHELGHQWWAHQVVGAEMQGDTMLSESLAQYSALMVMEKLYGPDQIRKFLKYELDSYLRARGSEVVEEVPLERVEDQPYIHYNKGALVMYLLKDELGAAAVNRALRKLLARYAFAGPPYASSKDLVALFRAEARPDQQQLITDLFERITLYDLSATKATATKRADGKYAIHFTVKARKLYADGKGTEREAPMANEHFDVGLFSVKPGTAGYTGKNVILFRREALRSGTHAFDFVVDRLPAYAGIDPYNKRIDRNSDDNLVAIGS